MRRGVFVPPFGALADPRILAELASRADDAGWDGFFLWDHLIYREPATHVLDPWIAMAVIATSTSRIRFGPMVTPLARRRPAVVARQLVALDIVSGGRVVLGVGLGLNTSGGELSSFGEELDAVRRAAMLDEALVVVRALCSGERVEHVGEHYRADGVRFLPPSVQAPIPIWVGPRWPNRAPLRRAVRYDGVFIIDIDGPDDVRRLVGVIDELRATRTATGGPFEIVVDAPPETDPERWRAAGATWLLTRFSQFDTEVDDVRRVIDAGPLRAP